MLTRQGWFNNIFAYYFSVIRVFELAATDMVSIFDLSFDFRRKKILTMLKRNMVKRHSNIGNDFLKAYCTYEMCPISSTLKSQKDFGKTRNSNFFEQIYNFIHTSSLVGKEKLDWIFSSMRTSTRYYSQNIDKQWRDSFDRWS